jgi:hypothetical protein
MSDRHARNGARIGKLFREARGLGSDRTCDLHRICEADDIDLAISAVSNPGYTACLVRPGADLPSGIILAPGQSPGRRRFSIAHELGHYYIPTHRSRPPGWCGEEDMAALADSGRRYEWEANDFAAELLMPKARFKSDAHSLEPTFDSIFTLADSSMYDVSGTAAALRYVELADEACAVVCARDNTIEWVAKSSSFRYRIPWRNDSLPVGSLARDVANGEASSASAQTIDPYVWLEVEQRSAPELLESTLAIPSQRQVLSLIWVVDEEDDDEW